MCDKQDQEAFTLIELLAVVIIIGILAAIAIPVYFQQQTRAREAVVVATLRGAAAYMEVGLTTDGAYPSTIGELETRGFRQGDITIDDADVTVVGDTYALRGEHGQQSSVVGCLRSDGGTPQIIAPGSPCGP